MSDKVDDKGLADDLVRTGQGDRSAFRRLYGNSAGPLFSVCFNITRDRAAAEDVLQEVYIKVWKKASDFEPLRARPLSWLATIARNTAIDWYRSRNRHVHLGEEELTNVPNGGELADDQLIREEQERVAIALVGELDAASEDDLKKIFFQGLTYAEAAKRYGIPLGTLKSRVRRAVCKIRDRLEND